MQTETKTEEIWAEEGICPKCGWNTVDDDVYDYCYAMTNEREVPGNGYYTVLEWNEHFMCPKCQTKFIIVNGN